MSEELEEQASLYVLGLLDDAEAAAFSRRLEADPELRRLVDGLEEAAAALSSGAAPRPLPPELRARILGAVSAAKTAPFPRKMNWLPWAIAAGLALAVAWLLTQRMDLQKRVTRLENRDYLAQIQIASLSSKLRSAPDANAVIAWDEKKQRGVLKVELPPNEKDHDYQLWMVDPQYQNPVGAGTFHVANDRPLRVPFQPVSPVGKAKGFAISLERKGGVTKAEGPIVLLGK